LIQEQSKTDWKEMYQVLTGHRMEIYVPEAVAQDITISKSFHVDAQIVEG
jgi:phosphoribosylformylglycinamidine cyclo-ligase